MTAANNGLTAMGPAASTVSGFAAGDEEQAFMAVPLSGRLLNRRDAARLRGVPEAWLALHDGRAGRMDAIRKPFKSIQ